MVNISLKGKLKADTMLIPISMTRKPHINKRSKSSTMMNEDEKEYVELQNGAPTLS